MSGAATKEIAPVPRDLRREIFSLADNGPVRLRTVLVAALGMGVPVVAGLSSSHAEAGLTIGLGAVLLSGANGGTIAPSNHRDCPSAAIFPAMIGLVSIAALLSGYSRPLAVGAIRFGVYLVLGAGFLDGAASGHRDAALVFGLGALWNIILRRLLAERASTRDEASGSTRASTPAQRRVHFRKTLRSLAGWQFAARLAIGLTVASAIRHLWPDRHFYWIMLTVVLLTQRPVEHLPVKTVQRLLGTIFGVGITWLIVTATTSPIILAPLACLLATLVPIALARSYLLYSIVATPLILLVLDLGRPIDVALLADRVLATVVGGTLVIAANMIADRLHRRDRGEQAMSMPR